jgi:predicted Zn-ribbon and HTH transcriptional regulator
MSEHDYAVCPDCGLQNVTLQTAPRKPPRMLCTNCRWNSLDGSSDDPDLTDDLVTDGGRAEESAAIEREESQTILQATRSGEEVKLKIAGREPVTLSVEEYDNLLTEIRRTKWLLADEEQLQTESAVRKLGDKFVGKGDCHECGYEGTIVENDIGTTYCPKCRSTNVGWPVR